jgi:hypothetical protein
LYGDQALLELGTRRAIHLDQLVGPYSRSGFHHPGPAVFYLLAPFVRLFEPSGPGLYLGAVILNATALIATVVIIWRRVGPLAALWAAAAIDLFCLCIGVGTLREPWNPYLVVAPMILFVVLWAVGWTGSSHAALWALVIGSFVIQTEIATAAVVLVLATSLVVRVLRGYWSERRYSFRRRWGPGQTIGGLLLIALWLPTVVELFRDRPNNLQLLWDFLTTGHAEPRLGQALGVFSDAVTVLPFGNHDYVLALHRNPIEVAGFAILTLAGIVVAVALGRHRRQPLASALATTAAVGALVGAVSLTHTDGPVYLYFALWLAYVPLAVLLAIGVAILGPRPATASAGGRARRPVVPVAVATAVLACVFALGLDLNLGPVNTTTGSGPWPANNAGSAQGKQRTIQDTAALTRAAESVLRPADRWVDFNIGSDSLWPYVAGIVLELDERGVQSTVGPAQWVLYFGKERTPGRPVSIVFALDPVRGLPVRPGWTVIAELDGAVLAYQRHTP